MQKRVFLIHGWEGYPEEGWRPWLKKELENRGYEVVIPSMPNTKYPKMNAWVSHLASVVGTPDKQCYFIGHSLGCVTILRYLETLKENQKIGGAIFVAGFSHDLEYKGYKGELVTFFTTTVSWEKVNKHCNKFIVLHSRDDRWVPLKHVDIFKEKLGAKTIIQDGMRHYSGDDGITELPIVLNELLKL